MLIRYFADLRGLMGRSQETWTKATPEVHTLLDELAAQYGPAFVERFFVDGQLSREIIIFVNGRDITHLRGVDTPLAESDEIAIFPVIAGG